MAGGVDELFPTSTSGSPRWARSPRWAGGAPEGLPALRAPTTTARCWARAPRSWCSRSGTAARARGARIIAEIAAIALGQRADRAPHRRGRDGAIPAPRWRGCSARARRSRRRALLRRRQRRSRGRRLGARAARPRPRRARRAAAAAIAGAALRPARRAGRAARGRGRAGRGARHVPRCSCTASRAAAAGPRWWWSRPLNPVERSPDRHPGLQRGRHHRRIVERARLHGPVLVVDDGSTDGAPRSPRRPAPRSSRSAGGGGKGAALRRGFAEARARGARSGVVTLDGDGQHDPDDIPRLLKAAVEDAAEPSSSAAAWAAARGIARGEQVMPAGRLAALRVAGFFIDWLTRRAGADTQSGFRVYPARLLVRGDAAPRRLRAGERDAAARRRAGVPDRRGPDRADPLRGPAQPVSPGPRRHRGRGLPRRPHRARAGRARPARARSRSIGIFSPARLRARHREMYAVRGAAAREPARLGAGGRHVRRAIGRSGPSSDGWRLSARARPAPGRRGHRRDPAHARARAEPARARRRRASTGSARRCGGSIVRRSWAHARGARAADRGAGRPADYDVLVVGGGPARVERGHVPRRAAACGWRWRSARPFRASTWASRCCPPTCPVLERLGVLDEVKARGFLVKYGAYFHDQEMDLGYQFFFREGKPWPPYTYEVQRGRVRQDPARPRGPPAERDAAPARDASSAWPSTTTA